MCCPTPLEEGALGAPSQQRRSALTPGIHRRQRPPRGGGEKKASKTPPSAGKKKEKKRKKKREEGGGEFAGMSGGEKTPAVPECPRSLPEGRQRQEPRAGQRRRPLNATR